VSPMTPQHFHSVIVGGGPAGTGPLIYGAWSGRLGELLDRGVAVVESGTNMCAGRLDRYVINSNSVGATFLECLEHEIDDSYLVGTRSSELYAQVRSYRNDVLPLSLVARLLKSIGEDLCAATTNAARSHAFLETRVEEVRVLGAGRFEVVIKCLRSDSVQKITANRVLLATGGNAQVACDAGATIVDHCMRHGAENRPMMITSEELLTDHGRDGVEAWLDGYDLPQVIVIGGAHSAMSSAWLLLERMSGDFQFRDGSVTLLHRSPIKVFYESVADADADGFNAYSADDVGSKGQVFPLAGLRGDAKALYRKISGLDSAVSESRAQTLPLPASAPGWDALPIEWSSLALVVFATGYTQPDVPIRNASGKSIPLQGRFTERFVDQNSRVLDTFGAPIQGLFATGFTTGFSPVEMLGGEPSYGGKENSVWLCQHLLGEQLFSALTA
jgi:hypothetical protein